MERCSPERDVMSSNVDMRVVNGITGHKLNHPKERSKIADKKCGRNTPNIFLALTCDVVMQNPDVEIRESIV